MTDFPEIEEFEDVEDVETSGEESGDEEKAPKAPKVVLVTQFDEAAPLFPADGFSVTLQSVGGRQYPFTEASKCLSWLTRRVYNGEDLSANAADLHAALQGLRRANTLMRRVLDLVDVVNDDFDPLSNAGVRAVNTRSNAIAKALPDDLHTAFTPFTNGVYTLLDLIEAYVNSEVHEEIEIAVDDEGNEVEKVASVDTAERFETWDGVQTKLAELEDVAIQLSSFLEVDPTEG